MSGIVELDRLLDSLAPELVEGEFIFCAFQDARYGDWKELHPIGVFQETEGLSLIVRKEAADHAGLKYESSFRLITLKVHSSLNAAGLTAAVSARLSRLNIPTNIVAAFHHDHLFVPTGRAEEALDALEHIQNHPHC